MFRVCRVFLSVHCSLVIACWELASCVWCFIVYLLLPHVVSWVRCGAWLYWFLIFAFFLIFFSWDISFFYVIICIFAFATLVSKCDRTLYEWFYLESIIKWNLSQSDMTSWAKAKTSMYCILWVLPFIHKTLKIVHLVAFIILPEHNRGQQVKSSLCSIWPSLEHNTGQEAVIY